MAVPPPILLLPPRLRVAIVARGRNSGIAADGGIRGRGGTERHQVALAVLADDVCGAAAAIVVVRVVDHVVVVVIGVPIASGSPAPSFVPPTPIAAIVRASSSPSSIVVIVAALAPSFAFPLLPFVLVRR